MGEETDNNVLVWRPAKRAKEQAPAPAPPPASTPTRYPVWSEEHRRWAYRSDMPITPDWWQCARFSRDLGIAGVARVLDCSAAHVEAIEAGTEQPTQDELYRYAALTDYPLLFFWQEPSQLFADPNTFNSLDYHATLVTYVCDPCERATGEEVDAEARCAECGDDLCASHVHLYDRDKEPRVLCERCWHKAIGHKAAQARQARRVSQSR